MPSGVKDIQLLELKDTISQLNKTISTQNELISSLQKMLEERNAKDSEKDLLIANLQSQLAYLKNKVFGSTSEIRHDQLDGQLNLFGTPVGDEKPAEVIEPEVISVKGYTKERKPKATYDDKYNSVRSICKHFFTDIVGLSIKFFCVSLRHMSIRAGVIGAVAFQQVDDAPDTETSAEGDNEGLKNGDSLIEKCHIQNEPESFEKFGLVIHRHTKAGTICTRFPGPDSGCPPFSLFFDDCPLCTPMAQKGRFRRIDKTTPFTAEQIYAPSASTSYTS